MQQNKKRSKFENLMRLLAILLLIAGVALRLYIYLQNRNLMLDEANVARNIAERGFAGLVKPLYYQQYAPPVFLWITKFFTLLFGMGEKALRLYPFLCGVAALYVFYKVAVKLMPVSTIWYPASLVAFSVFMIRYSSELKQYMSDVFIGLLIVWLALAIDSRKITSKRFFILWGIIGSLALWSSMPAVFLLAGAACYYGWQAIEDKQYKRIFPVIGASIVWLIQFGAYYLLILKEQANSSYLQNFHQYDFLFATPANSYEWQHNWDKFSGLMRMFEGMYPYVHDINTAFLIGGVILLFWKARAHFFLLIVPVLALCVAAALNQFSLMQRVSLFIVPVLVLIIGYGFSSIYYLKQTWVKVLVILTAFYAAGCNIAYMSERPFKYEELTEAMEYVKEKKIISPAITLYHSSVAAFIYYTTIHPDKEQWESIKDADRMHWYQSYDSLAWHMRYVWSSRQPLAVLYTNCTEEEFRIKDSSIRNHMELLEKMDKPYVKACIYIKPLPDSAAHQ